MEDNIDYEYEAERAIEYKRQRDAARQERDGLREANSQYRTAIQEAIIELDDSHLLYTRAVALKVLRQAIADVDG